MAHELMDTYSDICDVALRATLVTKENAIFTEDYEGDAKGGKVKIPVRKLEVKISNYDKAKGVAPDVGATEYIDLILDKDVAINEIIDGHDANNVPDNIVANRIASGSYVMSYNIDKASIDALEAAMDEIISNNVSDQKIAATSVTAYDNAVEAMVAMDTSGVPDDTLRWMIASPEYYASLLKDDHFIRASNLSQEMRMQGVVGQVSGFNVYKSALLSKNADKDGKKVTTEFITGHPFWCKRAIGWIQDVAVKDLTNNYIGASAVQGRVVHGETVTNKKALYFKVMESA